MQGVRFAVGRRSAMRDWIGRHGRIFEINVPFFGRSVVVSDPHLVRSVCAAGPGQLDLIRPNLGNWFGPGSIFGMEGERHLERRRLLTPALHGQWITEYERVIEDETLREIANWPEGQEFRTLPSMNRITLTVILRAVLGAEGSDLDRLREIIPPYMRLGQLLAFVPRPRFRTTLRYPRGRLDQLRTEFDRIVDSLIVRATTDPAGERTDVLARFLRSGPDGVGIPPSDLHDELMTLVCAGHETTAAALAWTFERLRRHPDVLADLIREVDSGGEELRRATIMETLRARPVIDVLGRRVDSANFDLGGWRIPRDRMVIVRIADLHTNPDVYPHPERFDPYRFLGARPGAPTWLPFGAGVRRCVGAGFALTEMDIVVRTVLRHYRIQTDTVPGEKSHFRGVAHTPKCGGRIVVSRRSRPA